MSVRAFILCVFAYCAGITLTCIGVGTNSNAMGWAGIGVEILGAAGAFVVVLR